MTSYYLWFLLNCSAFLIVYLRGVESAPLYNPKMRYGDLTPHQVILVDEGVVADLAREGRFRQIRKILQLLNALEATADNSGARWERVPDNGSDLGDKLVNSAENVAQEEDKNNMHIQKSKRYWEYTGIDIVSQIIREIEKQEQQQREMMRKG